MGQMQGMWKYANVTNVEMPEIIAKVPPLLAK